jgi:hypothetical protein
VVRKVTARSDERSLQGRALASAERVVSGNLSKDTTFVLPPYFAKHGTVSSMNVMIGDKRRPYGVLGGQQYGTSHLSPDSATFLVGLANPFRSGQQT